jgi:hypothetical protein
MSTPASKPIEGNDILSNNILKHNIPFSVMESSLLDVNRKERRTGEHGDIHL